MNKRWLLIPLLVIALSAFVGSGVFASGPGEGRTGRAEVRFLEGMMDHHQMALDMANDCLAKAETATVLTLCQNVIDTQSAEIEQMRQWLLEWYAITYTPMAMGDHMNMMGMMQDMTMQDMMGMMAMMNTMQDMTMQDMMEMMGDADMSTMTMQEMMGMMGENMGADMSGMDMGAMGDMSMQDMMNMMAMMNAMQDMTMQEMMDMMGDADMSTMTMQDMMNMMTENMGGMGGMDMGNTPNMDMPMMMGMMAGLSNLEGVEYEVAWLEAMIDHHDDALHMSERILKHDGIHAETAEMAQNIITAQTEEIALMEGMIIELSAE